MNESISPHNRRSPRSQVLMAASIEANGVATPVKLRNLSSDGVLVEGESLPAMGTHVLFRKNELRAAGVVAWVSGKRVGIKFDTVLDPEAVMHHVPKPRPRAKLDFRRPGLKSTELSDGERKIAEDWIWGKPVPWLED